MSNISSSSKEFINFYKNNDEFKIKHELVLKYNYEINSFDRFIY